MSEFGNRRSRIFPTLAGRRLGEVDVVSETALASKFQQAKKRGSFVSPGPAADHNDDAIMRPCRCEMEKVVPIASQKHATKPIANLEDIFVGGIAGEGLTQQRDIVPELLEQIAQIVGHILVEQEFQSEARAI
jgi:hypothetical protein